MNNILVVEADFALSERVCCSLTDSETQTYRCGTLESATDILASEKYDIIVIDAELPDGNSYDLIYEIVLGIYASRDAAIIVILPNDREPVPEDLIGQGIDDYITKPFSLAVLKAKIYTQLKKRKREFSIRASERFEAIGSSTKNSIGGVHKVEIEGYSFDFDHETYSVSGKTVKLGYLEQCTLRMLVENSGVVLKKRALIEKLGTESKSVVDGNVLSKTIRALSQKLGAEDYIKTIFGIGYMWSNYPEGGGL